MVLGTTVVGNLFNKQKLKCVVHCIFPMNL